MPATAPRLARTRLARARLAVVSAVVVGTAVTAPAAGAQHGCDGVGVVVDAVDLGGEVTTRCAPGDPSSGLDALEGAGHAYTFVPRQPGLVCTIDARPDPCNGAPTNAHWSYWHAEPGGSWTWSTRGAGNRDPAPGTVEGWAFGTGDPPRQDPPDEADATEEPTPDRTPDDAEPSGDDPTPAPAAAPPPDEDRSEEPGTDRPEQQPAATSAPRTAGPTDAPADTTTTTTTTTTDRADRPRPSPPRPRSGAEPASSVAPSPDDATELPDVLASDRSAPGSAPPLIGAAAAVLVAGIAGAGLRRARRRDREA